MNTTLCKDFSKPVMEISQGHMFCESYFKGNHRQIRIQKTYWEEQMDGEEPEAASTARLSSEVTEASGQSGDSVCLVNRVSTNRIFQEACNILSQRRAK